MLADVARHLERQGRSPDYEQPIVIETVWIEDAQGTELRGGDILLLRTGWLAAYLSWPQEKRASLPLEPETPGLARTTEEVAAWLWDHRIAAIFADNPAVERFPEPSDASLHAMCLEALLLLVSRRFTRSVALMTRTYRHSQRSRRQGMARWPSRRRMTERSEVSR